MLKTLTISNVLLIEKLEIEFFANFCVFTGETGAGKSVLLDALGLALGERSTTSLVRPGAQQAVVTALFEISPGHLLWEKLREHDLECTEGLLLRRSVNADGKSKAFINDQPVSLGLLRELAQDLVEIHGQFDQILQPSTHRGLVDSFGGHADLKAAVTAAFEDMKQARIKLQDAETFIKEQNNQKEFLAFAVAEFERIDPQANEEDILIEKRTFLQNQAKILEGLQKAHKFLSEEKGILDQLGSTLNVLERTALHCGDRLDGILEGLNRAHCDVVEAETTLTSLYAGLESGEETLESIENRLYELRALARKHGCLVAELPTLYKKLQTELALLEDSASSLNDLSKEFNDYRKIFIDKGKSLYDKRQESAHKLAAAVQQELQPLKLDKAEFKVELRLLPEAQWSGEGMDHVEFLVKTNPGLPFGAIAKIASGGERARLMLALKVVLAHNTEASILVFDEIDSGVGGAVAAAIGERLARLGKNQQILAITHSPQVASYATQHLFVQKHLENETAATTTSVMVLDKEKRREEIARMLSGDEVTNAARAAADQLINTAQMVA